MSDVSLKPDAPVDEPDYQPPWWGILIVAALGIIAAITLIKLTSALEAPTQTHRVVYRPVFKTVHRPVNDNGEEKRVAYTMMRYQTASESVIQKPDALSEVKLFFLKWTGILVLICLTFMVVLVLILWGMEKKPPARLLKWVEHGGGAMIAFVIGGIMTSGIEVSEIPAQQSENNMQLLQPLDIDDYWEDSTFSTERQIGDEPPTYQDQPGSREGGFEPPAQEGDFSTHPEGRFEPSRETGQIQPSPEA